MRFDALFYSLQRVLLCCDQSYTQSTYDLSTPSNSTVYPNDYTVDLYALEHQTYSIHCNILALIMELKGIVSRDFSVLFMISLDSYEVRARVG
jgi:hypothetical protein